MSVKVAVRLRPFNQREIDLDSKLILEMNGNCTKITNPEDGNKRDFNFDYSFWSHDGFIINEDGYNEAAPGNKQYSDQKSVFDKVGKEILDNAFAGYHCCLFAYGQTGAGKSYSMVGYGANKGIVPISCNEIFNRITNNQDKSVEFEVQVSMQEIYNERIQDLLIPIQGRPQGGLKVREHKIYGVYVENLTKHPVDSYEAIDQKCDEGNKNRTVGATLMNASSSRAHTIITIDFRQKEVIDGKKTEKISIINLIDLAGSEKLGKTGAQGDRMKEGCSINKSLSQLGLVIQKLAENASGKKQIIPFRDSQLTRILQNALGGNSKTLMICALSPAADNFEETLGTLRYADQAKKIKLNAVINESETDKLIRELKAENAKLMALLKTEGGNAQISGGVSHNTGNAQDSEEHKEKIKELENILAQNKETMKEFEVNFQQKLIDAKQKQKEDKEKECDITKPYLENLNEDPLLNGKVKYSLKKGKLLLGRKNGSPPNDIVLGGLGINPNHAMMTYEDEKCYVDFYHDEDTQAKIESDDIFSIYINGKKIEGKTEIHHMNRLVFGMNGIFLFKLPAEEPDYKPDEQEIDWAFAQQEIVRQNQQKENEQKEAQFQKMKDEASQKIQEMEEALNKEKQQAELLMKTQEEAYQNKLKELEQKIQEESKRQITIEDQNQLDESHQQQMNKIQNNLKSRSSITEKNIMQMKINETQQRLTFKKEQSHLEQKLAKYLPKVVEINLCAKELKRNINFQAKLSYIFQNDQDGGNDKQKKLKIQIKVINYDEGCIYMWDMKKFSNRYFIIKDILDQHFETNELPVLNQVDDPFWDPPEPYFIGQAFQKMMSLAYMLDNQVDLTIVSEKGSFGQLKVNLIPTDPTGTKYMGDILEEKGEIIEEPTTLIGYPFNYKVKIISASLIESNWKKIYIEYTIKNDEGQNQTFKTQYSSGSQMLPKFHYEMVHKYKSVDNDFIINLLNNNICYNIYGYQQIGQRNTKDEKVNVKDNHIINSQRDSGLNKNINANDDNSDPNKKGCKQF